MDWLWATWNNPLLMAALLAGIIASVVSGVIGSYVVVKRIVLISGSISHAVLGGVGIALWLQRVHGVESASPLYGALVASLISALLIGWIRLHRRQREDSAIATLWSMGMAIGILFIAKTPGYNNELTNYLVGNLLWVSPFDLLLLAGLDGVILTSVFFFHTRLLALCFDEEQALLQGVRVHFLYLLLLTLTAFSIVLLMQVVGIILVMAMLTLPATIANMFTTHLSSMMAIATLISGLLCIAGTALAYERDWPPGATIALLAGLSYLFALFINSAKPRVLSFLRADFFGENR